MIRVDQRPRRAGGRELLRGQLADRLHGDVAGVPECAGIEHALEHAESFLDQLPRLAVKAGGRRGDRDTHTFISPVRVSGVAGPADRPT